MYKRIASKAENDLLDLVFVGSTLIEHWTGNSVGHPIDSLKGIKRIFDQEFTTEGGGIIDGLALGISGDRVRKTVVGILRQFSCSTIAG